MPAFANSSHWTRAHRPWTRRASAPFVQEGGRFYAGIVPAEIIQSTIAFLRKRVGYGEHSKETHDGEDVTSQEYYRDRRECGLAEFNARQSHLGANHDHKRHRLKHR